MTERAPFRQDVFLSKPGIVGARWWQDSVREPIGRRNAVLVALLSGAGILGSVTVFAIGAKSCADDDTQTLAKESLEMQRRYGWSFGAPEEDVAYAGDTNVPLDRRLLDMLPSVLEPHDPKHRPFYVPTLFEAVTTPHPATTLEGEPTPRSLRDSLRPMRTAAMVDAFRRGRAVASAVTARSVALVVDLPGPEAVAFAAGASSRFDPVFLFDNWPHPRGVVPAHLTLAAATSLAPLLQSTRSDPDAPPMFVLDRGRLATYHDDAREFDNRYLARLPSADAMKRLGVTGVLYVAPTDTDRELDDVNEYLVAYEAAGIPARVVPAAAWLPSPGAPTRTPSPDELPWDDGTQTFRYGGSADPRSFGLDYPLAVRGATGTWGSDAGAPSVSTVPNAARSYVPSPRVSPYPPPPLGLEGAPRPRPAGFGVVPVVVSVATGVVLGAKMRSGTWNRASGGFGG